ncbi:MULTISPECIES: glycosyltransferase family 2 protein [unclassified Knoellia]|uniref:glycosyltransferase family 2 protein n=1 Tax=Knoellia altitudinis TaxID=3404795 RepID=UPI003621243E
MPEQTVVVTIAHGRHHHLREQRRALHALSPDTAHVIVAMDDPDIDEVAGRGSGTTVVHVAGDPRGLPLAHARNVGVEVALAAGAGLVVLLDVDCAPGPQLVPAYERAAALAPGALLAGPVTYLDEGTAIPPDPWLLEGLRAPHAVRPDPPAGELERGGDHDLFWSLSCALTPATWRAVGGFHEDYVGYGAEDTDFGWTARSRGVDLVWVGGADAFHQFHPVSHPPVEHVADIVRNATTFHERWGRWPMHGWLDEFARRGLVTFDGDSLRLVGA